MALELELAGYRDITLVGQGGLGRVYRAVRVSTGGLVAIKELRDIAAASPAWHRARRELDAMLRLKGHPFVVSVEEIIEGPNGPCIVMEFVHGGSLHDRLGFGPMTGPELVLVGQQVSQALAAAHDEEIVHRDVKPQNLLVGSFGQVKVCDFGIASLVRGPGGRTQTQALTLGYASPEELDGEEAVGSPADVYSFGATMLHLLTGRKPSFQDRLAGGPVSAGLQVNDPVLIPVLGGLERCMAHRPADRLSMPEIAAMFETASYQLGPRRLTRLDSVEADEQRTTRRPAAVTLVRTAEPPQAPFSGGPSLPLHPAPLQPTPGPVHYVAAHAPYPGMLTGPPASATVVHGVAPVYVTQAPQPQRSQRGIILMLVGLGAVVAVCAGILIGLITQDQQVSQASAPAAADNGAVQAAEQTVPVVAEVVTVAATTTAPPVTAPPATVPSVAVPATTQLLPTLPPTTVTLPPPPLVIPAPVVTPASVTTVFQPLPGDLGLSIPMVQPFCDGSYVTMISSATRPDQWIQVMQNALANYPGSQYMRTESTCPSLRARDADGNQIYSAFFGPYATKTEACYARGSGPNDAYIRLLDMTTPATAQQLCG